MHTAYPAYACIYTPMHACTHICTYILIHINIWDAYARKYRHIHASACIYIHIHGHVCFYAHIHVYTYICTYTCIYTYIHNHKYIYGYATISNILKGNIHPTIIKSEGANICTPICIYKCNIDHFLWSVVCFFFSESSAS